MKQSTRLTTLLGIDHPIIQGPFGGGMSSAQLAASVSNAGGLGSYGAHILTGLEIETLVADIRSRTQRPFAINLWVSEQDERAKSITQSEFEQHRDQYNTIYAQLGIEAPSWPVSRERLYESQVEAVLKTQPAVFSFVFGIPSREIIEACRKRNIVTIGTATTLEEALAVEAAGCDAVVATGFEAGGHRPSFIRAAEDSLMGTLALVPIVADAVRIPVIAAGGIADRRGVQAAFALGAHAAQIGTAFLACEESGAHALHRASLFDPAMQRTLLSRGFTGRLARYLENGYLRSFTEEAKVPLPFPLQHTLTGPIKNQATVLADTEHMALYGSQSTPLLKYNNAAELMQSLLAEK
ncbi:MAG: NAD(P)H-dependent flavin oxidoreductase [Opitutaceae bacterium]